MVCGYLCVYPSPLRLRDVEARGLAAALSPKGYTPPLQQREAHSHISHQTHTSHGEREREKKRGQDQRERDCLEMQQLPVLPLYSQCLTGKLLEWNNIRPKPPQFSRLRTQHACYHTYREALISTGFIHGDSAPTLKK